MRRKKGGEKVKETIQTGKGQLEGKTRNYEEKNRRKKGKGERKKKERRANA